MSPGPRVDEVARGGSVSGDTVGGGRGCDACSGVVAVELMSTGGDSVGEGIEAGVDAKVNEPSGTVSNIASASGK